MKVIGVDPPPPLTKAMKIIRGDKPHPPNKNNEDNRDSSIEHGGTRAIFIFMAMLTPRMHIYGFVGPL